MLINCKKHGIVIACENVNGLVGDLCDCGLVKELGDLVRFQKPNVF